MPRLSLWRAEKSNDYRFLDRTIREMFSVGGTDLYIHKYVGANNPTNSTDATQPYYPETTVTNIQDLLFQENRDRKYDDSIYRLRGHYNVQNLDFDLSQFGLFLTNDIVFITVHYNDMIDIIGRKLMVGDVFELPHLTDYHPLNESIPIGLRRYYQITDANFASEGFSQTWWPHLWRIKCEPLVNSQEFKDILNKPTNTDNYLGPYDPEKTYPPGYTILYGDKIYESITNVPIGINPPNPEYWEEKPNSTLGDLVSTYNKNISINDAAIEEARRLVPKLGYDRQQLYVEPTFVQASGALTPAPPISVIIPDGVPAFATGALASITSSSYSSPSFYIPIIRAEVINGMRIRSGTRVVLQAVNVNPATTGSGPVSGTIAIMAVPYTTYGNPVTVPYGTADNTYATADQYASYTVVSRAEQSITTTIEVVDLTDRITTGLSVQAYFKNYRGEWIQIFQENTTIVSYDTINNTFTINQPTLSGVQNGTRILLGGNFTGTVSQQMNYQSDCDPRFQYIRRASARSFGYITGYNSGDGTAPNGFPVDSGTNFPSQPQNGDYFLRTDYIPQKLFRWSGKVWTEISRNVRTATGFTLDDESQLSTFINNSAVVSTSSGTVIPSRQSLSNALRIKPD